ncbi:MAG TPA: ABC transporter permease [Gemmatimonadaceae bacterium]|nr:ABC transporter permease [Gemmatimonadaceae bacterium]
MNVHSDIRFALRAFRRAPLVSALAIACIGLGIGAVTTVYSTASAFTFRPLPQLHDAGRLVLLMENPAGDRSPGVRLTPGTFGDARRLPEFSAVGAFVDWAANVAGFDVAERVNGARVSADFFRMTGRSAALGRTITEEDVASDRRAVVLSRGLWMRRFGGDPDVVGARVRINGEGYDVIGVMPADFAFPPAMELWVPLSLSPAAAADRTTRSLFVVGRLAPGVSTERGAAAAKLLGERIAADHADTHGNWIISTQSLEEFFGAGPRPFMVVLLAAVGFLLLIACANVANLLLVRATARRREMGLRVAVGATRWRLVSQLMIESVLLALAGGAVGIALAWWGVRATAATVPVEVQRYLPGFGAIALDYRAMAVAAAASMLAGVLFGLVPALTATSVDVNSALKDAGNAESRRSPARVLRGGLVVGEIALALMLVAGAALMATTFRHLSLGDPGFRTSGTLTAAITLPESEYRSDSSIVRFWDRLREGVAAQPGVAAAEITSVLPMSWSDSRMRVHPEDQKPDRPEEAPSVGFRRVSAGYLRALEVTRMQGRSFTDADRLDAPLVVVMSETAARRLFPGASAIGRRLVIRDRVATVVGVVRDVRGNPLTSDSPTSLVYAPIAQWPSRTATVVLQVAAGDVTARTAGLRRAISEIDPRLAAGEIATMQRMVEMVTSPQSATAQMLLASAFIALMMAAIGTYGVMAYAAARRTREIGVRVALGATSGMIARLMLAGAFRLIAIGVALGALGAIALGRSMQAILVDTSWADPVILAGAGALLAVIGLAAGGLPALRARRVDPVVALTAD